MAQETLLEAAERYAEEENDCYANDFSGFINGAKWQQEQDKNKYSEEEVLEILNEFSVACYSPIEKFEIPEWFKKFKKK